MADLETDADQSHPGIGSYQAENLNQQTATGSSGAIALETIITDLRCFQQQQMVEKATMQKNINDLSIQLRRALEEMEKAKEEKDIWLEKCQKMESMVTMATEAGHDQEHSLNNPESGIKSLEIVLQENAFLKTETEGLKRQIESLRSSSIGNTVAGGASYQDGKSQMQPTADDHTRPEQHEMPHRTLTSQVSQQESTDGAGDAMQHDSGLAMAAGGGRHTSLSERRGVQSLSLDEPGYIGVGGQMDIGGAAGEDREVFGNSSEADTGDTCPSSDMLQFLATKLGQSEYKPVLRHAGYDDKHFEDIEYRHHRDAQECRFQSLNDWQERQGRQATVRRLVHAMLKQDIRQKAEDFCREYDFGFLIDEYDSVFGDHEEQLIEGQDEYDSPMPPEMEGDIPHAPAPEPGPLEKIIGPLMNDPSSFEEEFMQLIEDCNFTQDQLASFMKEQKWNGAAKTLFEQELINVLGDVPTVANVLTSWALTVGSLFDSNPHYTVIDKRKPVWKLMQSLRKSHEDLYKRLKEEKIFPGGVLGLDTKTAKSLVNKLNFSHHNKMKQLLQQHRDDGNDWRGVAAKIPVEQLTITNWGQKTPDAATADTLRTFGTSGKGTVQRLYEVFVELGRGDVAEILEEG